MIKAIYKITNKINQKIYIGQSLHPEKRWWEHCQRAITQTDSYPIHLAIFKYGKENFSFEILEWTENYDIREKELIKEFNSLSPNGYNLIEGGHSPIMIGEQHPRNTVKDEILLKIVKDLKNNIKTDKQIAKEYNLTDKIIADINHGYSHNIPGIIYPIRNRHGSQKLTEEQVKEIKNKLKNTNLSYSKIGEQYGVSKGTIYHINTGRTFKENVEYPIRSK